MRRFSNVDEALDFAITEEQHAYELYHDMAREARSASMQQVFEQFAAEECAHRSKLEGVRTGGGMQAAEAAVMALSVTDYMVAEERTPVTTYQSALLFAMQKEKAAYRMYADFAGIAPAGLRELFLSLAHEEANHKLRFELEYDAMVSPEN
jgi:rubrerythrin